jgi:thiol-disulfide isomerase/thioredoxin
MKQSFLQRRTSWLVAALVVALIPMAFSPPALLTAWAAKAPGKNPFPGKIAAPSLDGGVEWLNTQGEITLKDLRGKIVLLDFWTYCCINCMHILPDLKYLEKKYANELVVIGVHVPKFENEHDTENIREAILRYDIEHPVINDANMTIARKYAFSSWPTVVLIDPQGKVVGSLSGEGNRETLDNVIGKLVDFHRAAGTLDESPVSFRLERQIAQDTPLRFPGKILVDDAGGRLFISDSNHNRIVVSSLDGKLIDTIGKGSIGHDDGGYADASFDHPQGMTLVDNILYVADTENHMLRTVDLEKKQVETLGGTGKQASFHQKGGVLKRIALNSPWAITNLHGTLYIAMAGPHQIWSHKIGSPKIDVFAGTGREDIQDGPRDDAALAQPSGITNDGKVLYHVDSEGSSVRMDALDSKGLVTTLVGTHDLPQGQSLFAFGDQDGRGGQARLQHPLGVYYYDGGLFVADTYNHKIKHVDLKTLDCVTWLGSGKRGNGLDPVELSEPADMAVQGDRLIVADTNNHRILSVNLKTKKAEEIVIQGLTPPDVKDTTPPKTGRDVEAVKLHEQSVKPGENFTFRVEFKLPEEFKLNPEAPPTFVLKAKGDQSLIGADNLDARLEATQDGAAAIGTIPLAAQAGEGTFELKVSYAYCRDGVGGVCKFASAAWEFPLRVASDAAETTVSLTAPPPSN